MNQYIPYSLSELLLVSFLILIQVQIRCLLLFREKQSTTKSTKPQTKTSAETSNDPLRVGAPRRPHPHKLVN